MSLVRVCDRCGFRGKVIGDFMPSSWARVKLPATDRHPKPYEADLCAWCRLMVHVDSDPTPGHGIGRPS